MFRSQPCTCCGRDNVVIYQLTRFPTVKPCFECIRKTQLGLVQIMGEDFVREVLHTNQPHFLFHISNGQYAIGFNVSTAAQGWHGWNE